MIKFISLFLLILFSIRVNAETNTIKISSGVAPPYIMEEGSSTGFISKIVHKSLDHSNNKPQFIFTNWTKAQQAVDLEHHLSYWWQKNNEREKKWLFSQPIYKAEFVFLARKTVRFYWTRYDQLRPYKIGLSRIQSYGPQFDSYVQYLNTEQLVSDYTGIKALLNSELDVILIEKALAKYLLGYFSQKDNEQLELLDEQVIYTEPYYLVCAKSFVQCNYLIEVFNVGLNEVKSSGSYQAIVEEFFEGINEN
ncbi:substrate-binding periplasmic protein [Psychrosphaera aestuarii]|uniref:substrate-binding periplasmic protein n=1 Tax=Psychrosphaera aestuarii TaxID=1266052 RepID=UPI001B31A408|nr:transporter substrate-binding domain-containing protein [Psychrosphaera aestuarii]